MVWACFNFRHGLIDFKVFPQGYMMNSTAYQKDVLDPLVLPFFQRLGPAERSRTTFMQDNAAPHTTASNMSWFETHHIPLIHWAPHSPDLNPIELIWAVVKSFTNQMDASTFDGMCTETSIISAATIMAMCPERMPSVKERMVHNWAACVASGGDNRHATG
jgi:hypothetical protein